MISQHLSTVDSYLKGLRSFYVGFIPTCSLTIEPMNYSLLRLLNVLSIIIEFLFDASKFVLVHTIALAIITTEYIQSVDWARVVRNLKDTQEYINQQFVYA